MERLAEILEQQLESAVEIKDKESLHRYILLLTENLAHQDKNEREHSEIMQAILKVDSRMEEGFRRMDERFEAMQKQMDQRFTAVDKRFESMQKQMDERFTAVDQRFSQMFWFITATLVVLGTLITVFQFLG